jgi:RecA-family ATPase
MTNPHNFPAAHQLAPWISDTLANPMPPFLVEKWLPAAGLTFIVGRPKRTKKSWLTQTLGMMVATGESAAGLVTTRKGNVLMYSREGAAPPIAERFLMLDKGLGLSVDKCTGFYHAMNGAVYLDEPAHVTHITRLVAEAKIDLVIFDTFARSQRGDENSARDMSNAMRGVERIRDAGAATILVHHARKAGSGIVGGAPDPDAGLRGSSALQGAYDSIISLQELEVDGVTDLWAIVGGKYVDYLAYRVVWDIRDGSAVLTLDGPQELPEVEAPEQKARF